MMTWLEQARQCSVPEVAERLGLDVRPDGRSFGPCVVCGAKTRANPGRSDHRGRCAVFPGGKWWSCYSNGTTGCGAQGDGIALVALAVAGRLWADGDRAVGERVHDWFHASGLLAPSYLREPPRRSPTGTASTATPNSGRPNLLEVAQAWFHGRLVSSVPEVARYLDGRGLDPAAVDRLELARALPPDPLALWMRFKGRTWRETGHLLLVPAWEPDPRRPGFLRMVSVHARCVRPCEDGEKAAWPAGANASGLVMAADDDPLREGRDRRLVTVCEGVPDFLVWALQAPSRRGALLGGWSGSAQSTMAALLPKGWTVALATHADPGGDAQARAWKRQADECGSRCVRCRPRRVV